MDEIKITDEIYRETKKDIVCALIEAGVIDERYILGNWPILKSDKLKEGVEKLVDYINAE